MLLVGTRSKLSRLGDIEPLTLYGSNVVFVKQYNYLGVIIDAEMTLGPFFTHVKKIVYSKIFVFSKIRRYLNESAAIKLYKHTILYIKKQFLILMFIDECRLKHRNVNFCKTKLNLVNMTTTKIFV